MKTIIVQRKQDNFSSLLKKYHCYVILLAVNQNGVKSWKRGRRGVHTQGGFCFSKEGVLG